MAGKAFTWRATGPLMLLAASALPGCAAVAIPIVAGGAMVARTADSAAKPERTATSEPAAPAPVAVAAARPQPVAPQRPAPLAQAASPPSPANPNLAARAPLASMQITNFDPAFALFAERALTIAAAHKEALAQDEAAVALSAMLADPVELDGRRAQCLANQPAAVLIDLDPAGGKFAPPSVVTPLVEHAAALARLREGGILIGWVTQNSVTQTGAIRSALEQSGLDPRGRDVLLLIAGDNDRKQSLRESFARSACIIAIAGDDRTDFDERFRYLRNPAAGAGLDRLIGDAWHLVRPLFPSTSTTGTPTL